jgi:hypothetical protein
LNRPAARAAQKKTNRKAGRQKLFSILRWSHEKTGAPAAF